MLLTYDRKKYVTMRVGTLIACLVCLVGVSVLAAYRVARFEYSKQLAARDRQIGAMLKNEKALTGRNVALLHSLRKMEKEYGKLYTAKTETNGPALKPERHVPVEEHHGAVKETPPVETVLGPTWVGAGKAVTLFGGALRIVLNQASVRDMCRKGSVVGSISSAEGRQKLCLMTGTPVKFKYRGVSYMMSLSGIAGTGNVYNYYISVWHQAGEQ